MSATRQRCYIPPASRMAVVAACVTLLSGAAAPPDSSNRAASSASAASRAASSAPGMVWIPGGEFVMGSDDTRSANTERPAHRVRLDGFWIDSTEVTNHDYRRFVDATGYRTLAERPVDWEELKKQTQPGTPKPPDEMLQPGALVFVPPKSDVSLDDAGAWWRWVTGANWRHPEGPGSDLTGREQHPVVCVAWEDAVAYARWAGKRLPTEAEWEYAARGGLHQQRFVWGATEADDAHPQANIWQGRFPNENRRTDRFDRTAPVGSFAPNGFGLYDMPGNVWEWCLDYYRADWYARLQSASKGATVINPAGPPDCWDPDLAVPESPARVIRGGSFLCHRSYCEAYRPSARRGLSVDTGMSHVGFRCVRSAQR